MSENGPKALIVRPTSGLQQHDSGAEKVLSRIVSDALTIARRRDVADTSARIRIRETETNITDRVTVPFLSYETKVWTIAINGEKTKLVKTNDDGDVEPVGTMRIVILDYATRRGRALYEGAYDSAKPGKPTCWSEDGIKPHASVAAKQSSKCDGCPMSIKRSKVNDNDRPLTACSQHRMLAVIPANRLDFTPLRLKLSITSDWDGQSQSLEAQGWFAFGNFISYLQKKGATHTAAFVTKMRFDSNVMYPKVMFAHDRWLSDAELAVIRPIVKSDEVKGLLAGIWTPTGERLDVPMV